MQMVGMEPREALLYEKLSDNKVCCHLCAHPLDDCDRWT
jgi:hypothetical protein